MSLFFISALFIGCQSAPKKASKNILEGKLVDALCSIEGLPVAETNAVFIKSQDGYYLLKTEDGLIITLPVSSCILQIQGHLNTPLKPSRSVNSPI